MFGAFFVLYRFWKKYPFQKKVSKRCFIQDLIFFEYNIGTKENIFPKFLFYFLPLVFEPKSKTFGSSPYCTIRKNGQNRPTLLHLWPSLGFKSSHPNVHSQQFAFPAFLELGGRRRRIHREYRCSTTVCTL